MILIIMLIINKDMTHFLIWIVAGSLSLRANVGAVEARVIGNILQAWLYSQHEMPYTSGIGKKLNKHELK